MSSDKVRPEAIASAPEASGPGKAFGRLYSIVARLRAPDGCPWDREQTPSSLRGSVVEEAYELVEAIDESDAPHVAEEAGDLFLLATMICYMHEQKGSFSVADSLAGLCDKLVRRHPHVFGEEASRAAGNQADVDAAAEGSSAAVLRNWDEIKAAEKKASEAGKESHQPSSRLDTVQHAMPALAEAAKLGSKAAKSGFDWPDWRGLLPKLAEETAELEAEASSSDPARKPAVEAELGDLLFTVVNLGRHLGVDAEMALRGCNRRFRQRFRQMELASAQPLEELAPDALEALWEQAKRKLAADGAAPNSQPEPRP